MHLFEALLALHEATGGAEWLERAAALRGLFDVRFFSAEQCQLTEFFDADWRETLVDGSFIREPGHHFEWVWLLHRYGQLSGDDSVLPIMEQLFGWAWAKGIDRRADGIFGAYDAVDPDGRVLQGGSKRLWPQTEALKACLALAERCGHAEAAAGIPPLAAILLQPLRRARPRPVARPVRRRRRDDRQGGPPPAASITSFLAMAEVLRAWPTLPASRRAV